MFKREGKPRQKSVLILSAHSDDFVLGAGGTISKYVQQGTKVQAVVFSYGEKSHPWLKRDIIKRLRYDETKEAAEILGCSLIFFDLRELRFLEDAASHNTVQELKKIIAKRNPQKIFTHSHEDPHPDHQRVHEITLSLLEQVPESNQPEVYIYSVWNPVSLRTIHPSLYVKTAGHFWTKMRALAAFRSQKLHIAYPVLLVLLKSIIDGFKMKSSSAERFYRIR